MAARTSLHRTGVCLLAVLTLPLAACGGDEDPAMTTQDAAAAPSTEAPPPPSASEAPLPPSSTEAPPPPPDAGDMVPPSTPGAPPPPPGSEAPAPEEGTTPIPPGEAAGEHDDSGEPPAPAGPGTTDIRIETLYGADGYPTAAWTIEDLTGMAPIGCWAPSGAVNGGPGYLCGSSAERGLACTPNPLAEDEVVCVLDPVQHTGYRRTVETPLPEPAPADQLLPLTIELADGSRWSARSGGAATESPDGLVPFYWCESGCEGEALWGPSGGEAIDTSDEEWTIRRAAENGTETTYEVQIGAVWLVGVG